MRQAVLSQHGRSGQHPDGELLGRELAAAVVDPDGEAEGSRRRGGALDTTGGCLHGKARREGPGDVRPGVGGTPPPGNNPTS